MVECVVVRKLWPRSAAAQTELVDRIAPNAWRRVAEMPDIVHNRGVDMVRLADVLLHTKHGCANFNVWRRLSS